MRQLSTFFLLIICFLFSFGPAQSVVVGKIEYPLAIDYTKLSENEISQKALNYYNLAKKNQTNEVNEDTTNALFLYTILAKKNPENISYPVRLGILYDKINNDKFAKTNFSRAIATESNRPEPYYYFGEFYFKRERYSKAMTYYHKAFERGYDKNYEMLIRMADIYEKFGNSKEALKYLNLAKDLDNNTELSNEIKKLRNFDKVNKEFYQSW